MTIDIITYTAEQFANLTAEELMEIKEAQSKKDRLKRRLDEKIQKEKNKLVAKGIFNSELFSLLKESLTAEYEAEVLIIREGLIFYLLYSDHRNGESIPPYTVNYAHTYEERYMTVKAYYESAYTDGEERFIAFCGDKFAVRYLGELYATLYDYILELR